jgi:mono/diheme cytochrome c family protein
MKVLTGLKLTIISIAGFVALATVLHSGSTASPAAAAVPAGFDAAAVYKSKCAMCHGPDGKGTQAMKGKGQPDFTTAEFQKSRTDAQLSESISNGKGKLMPAFKGKVSDGDIAGLVRQIRSFAKSK